MEEDPAVSTPVIQQNSNADQSAIDAEQSAAEAAQAQADGGFVLYPNMSNTNQLQSVYKKH